MNILDIIDATGTIYDIYIFKPMSLPLNENKTNPHSQLLHNFHSERQQFQKIKEQNKILASLHDKVSRKDIEIEELTKYVDKYKKYYDEYDRIAALLRQKSKEFEKLDKEHSIVLAEMERAMEENRKMEEKLLEAERAKHDHIKERNSSDKRLRDIQDTFREYQSECKNKESQLLLDLEKAYRQIKEMNEKCEDLQVVRFENEQLKSKLTAQNSVLMGQNPHHSTFHVNNSTFMNPTIAEQNSMLEFENRSAQLPPPIYHSQNISSNQPNKKSSSKQKSPQAYKNSQELLIINGINLNSLPGSQQIELLKKELSAKELQLQRSKNLNHELSIEFDKSVNKICEFEKELSSYRKQNHQLKRTLSLFVEKEQYEKMHREKLEEVERESEQSEEEESWAGDGDSSNRYQISNSYGRSSQKY